MLRMSVSRNRIDLQLSSLSFPWVKLQPQADLRVIGCRGYRGSEDASGGPLRWRRSDWSSFASSDPWEARSRGSSPECRRCGSGFRCSGALPASSLWRDPIAALSHCVTMAGDQTLYKFLLHIQMLPHYRCRTLPDVKWLSPLTGKRIRFRSLTDFWARSCIWNSGLVFILYRSTLNSSKRVASSAVRYFLVRRLA